MVDGGAVYNSESFFFNLSKNFHKRHGYRQQRLDGGYIFLQKVRAMNGHSVLGSLIMSLSFAPLIKMGLINAVHKKA